MSNLIVPLFILAALFVGGLVFLNEVVAPIEECRRTHNVYRCELVAVPVNETTMEKTAHEIEKALTEMGATNIEIRPTD